MVSSSIFLAAAALGFAVIYWWHSIGALRCLTFDGIGARVVLKTNFQLNFTTAKGYNRVSNLAGKL